MRYLYLLLCLCATLARAQDTTYVQRYRVWLHAVPPERSGPVSLLRVGDSTLTVLPHDLKFGKAPVHFAEAHEVPAQNLLLVETRKRGAKGIGALVGVGIGFGIVYGLTSDHRPFHDLYAPFENGITLLLPALLFKGIFGARHQVPINRDPAAFRNATSELRKYLIVPKR